jgi:hypothetical protein
MYDGQTFELRGMTFRFRTEADTDHGAPWEEEDGHGPVSEWRRSSDYTGRPAKRAGERMLCNDGRGHGSARFYDVREAMRIAKRDGWGISEPERAKLAAKLGREPTRGDICARAVEMDFDYLRRWCNDDWSYIGVIVELLDEDEEPTGEGEALWGVGSDSSEYIDETAHELAGEIAHRVEASRTNEEKDAARRARKNARDRARRARDKANGATVKQLRAALRAVLPYVLSRCEDMSEAATRAENFAADPLHSRKTRSDARRLAKEERRYADKAAQAFERAAALLPGERF